MVVTMVLVVMLIVMLMLVVTMLYVLVFVFMISFTDMLMASRFWLEVTSLTVNMIFHTKFLDLIGDLILYWIICKSTLHTILVPVHTPIRALMAMRLLHCLITGHILALFSTLLLLITWVVSIRVRVAVVVLAGHESMRVLCPIVQYIIQNDVNNKASNGCYEHDGRFGHKLLVNDPDSGLVHDE